MNPSHLYSCRSHQAATPVVVFAVSWISQKPPPLHLPKMLLNSSPFHSPMQLLMAFSSRKVAQLNQQKAFGQRKGGREVFAAQRKMFFPSWHSWTSTEKSLVSELYFSVIAILKTAGECCVFVSQGAYRYVACTVWGCIWHLINQNIAMLPLLIRVMPQETEEGERYVWRCWRMEEWGVIKQPSSQTPPLADPVCLCEFMATVWGGK